MNGIPGIVQVIAERISTIGGTALLVGGSVRDQLLNRPIKDIDIEVYHLPDWGILKSVLSDLGSLNEVGQSFAVLKLTTSEYEVDLSFPRLDSKIDKGHRGFEVQYDPNLSFSIAASRRDFTINSMGFNPLTKEFFDPFHGKEDLDHDCLRHIGSAFVEDPLRVLRAAQFAARFELSIAALTISLCQTMPINELPRERIFEELKKLLLKSKRPSCGLTYFKALGIFNLLPELAAMENTEQDPEYHPEGNVWIHTMMVIDEMATLSLALPEDQRLSLMLAALCHDLGKPATTDRVDGRIRAFGHDLAGVSQTKQFLARITQDKRLIDKVLPLVKFHLRPAQLYHSHLTQSVSDGAIRRLSIQVSIPELLLLAKADHLGRLSPDALQRQFPAGEWLSERAKHLTVFSEQPSPLLTGKHLLTLGVKPGPHMGALLKQAFDYQIEHGFSDLDEAIAFVRKSLLDLFTHR